MLALLMALALAQPTPLPGIAPLALTDVPVVIWSDGEATVRFGLTLTALPMAPGIGDVLDASHTLELASDGRLVLLVGGERLVVLRGPGTWRVLPGSIETAFGAAPKVESLAPYREGPLPGLEAPSSQPPDDVGLGATLALVDPRAPVARAAPTTLRWHWPHDGGTFELTIARKGADKDEVIEHWRNLPGREHTLWSPLAGGNAYRVTLALMTPTGPSDAIVDRRTLRILAEPEVAAIDGALAALDALAAEAAAYRPEYDVLRARMLESNGLLGEAESVWTGLSILYPQRDELYQQAVRLHRRSSLDAP
ncbi:MAG: hypothetical protein U1F43_20800 [Myxococcota bacterium]